MSLLSTSELLKRLQAYGVVIRKGADGRVVQIGNASNLPDELRQEMESRRAEIRSYIFSPPAYQPRLDFNG